MRHTPLLLLLAAVPALASGPMGHFIKSSHTLRQIQDGTVTVPQELKQVLKDPDCQRAFNGGSVGPDLVESKSHYGNTGALANRMLEAARANMKRAATERDPEAFDAAKKELAFAYGWMHHMAADLNVHPKINERCGDTYRHLDKGGKLSHGAFEGQETAWLKRTIWNPEDRYDVDIPVRFLSQHTGVPPADIINARKVLKAKAAAELFETGKVKLTDAQLRQMFEGAIQRGFADTETFLNNPKQLGAWDLDSGRIGSEEFDALRQVVKVLNGGTLPESWGRNYLAWHEAVKGLPRDQMLAKLRELMGLAPKPEPKPDPTPEAKPLPPGTGTNGTFPAEPFNGLQITYSIGGATVTSQKDAGGFTNSRTLEGTLGGSELRVVGRITGRDPILKSEWGPFWTQLTVTVSVDGETKTLRLPEPMTPEASKGTYSFDVSVPIRLGSKRGSIRVHENWVNPRFGDRGLIVSGDFKAPNP